MTHTTEYELNNKLLEWLSITDEYINFIGDVRQCISEIEPKLSDFNITKPYNGKPIYSMYVGLNNKFRGYAQDDDVALAFCRAVEQVVDKEHEEQRSLSTPPIPPPS